MEEREFDEMEEKETGILCFVCGNHSGIDCPGRRSDEATRCKACMSKFFAQMREADQVMDKDKSVLKKLGD